jgi:hypothetical protein
VMAAHATAAHAPLRLRPASDGTGSLLPYDERLLVPGVVAP